VVSERIKLLCFIRRNAEFDRRSWLEQWRARAQTIMESGLQELTELVAFYERLDEPNSAGAIHSVSSAWDGVATMTFASVANAKEALNHAAFGLLEGCASNVSSAQIVWARPLTVLGSPTRQGVVRFVLLKRRSDLTRPQFSSYWRGQHAALVTSQPSIRARMCHYIQNHAADLRSPQFLSAFDGVVETEYASINDSVSVLADSAVAQAIRVTAAILIGAATPWP
jgi:hypothetical protein